MDWFKNNPFFGMLGLATALLLAAAGYFLFDAHGRYQSEVATFEEQTLSLQRLQGDKPFPSAKNVELARAELDGARAALEEIAQKFQVEIPTTTPQGFQDVLRERVNDITERAAANGVALGEGFYLGFEAYETQPPSAAAAGPLASQLESIHAVAVILVEAKVREISGVTRGPLLSETSVDAQAADGDDRKPRRKQEEKAEAKDALPELVLAPFDVAFTAEQSAFRAAFNRILETAPPVFVRIVGVTNSAPAAPSKSEPADDNAEPGIIKPVLGQELTIVNLRLAAVSAGARSAE